MRKSKHTATAFAILAATLYAINIPFSKLLLNKVPPTMMAAFLYLGAGLGLFLYGKAKKENESILTKAELPYIIGMIVLDIIAPILLMLGLQYTDASGASLLNNFEIVITSLIAVFLFHEVLSRQLIVSIILVTIASTMLCFDADSHFQFNWGSLLVLAASCCWGLENNCTRMLSTKSSVQITTIKGIFSGFGSLIVALVSGEKFPSLSWIAVVLVLGFVAYGLSINFYIKAQKDLGAAKTSAYYSIAPFIGVLFGILLLQETPGWQFYVGLALMICATILMVKDTISVQHIHPHSHVHTHTHSHGDVVHCHEHTHTHCHNHVHNSEESTHTHSHDSIEDHDHSHTAVDI